MYLKRKCTFWHIEHGVILNTRGGAYPWCLFRACLTKGGVLRTPPPPHLLCPPPPAFQQRHRETSRGQGPKVKRSNGPFYCHSLRNESASVCVSACLFVCFLLLCLFLFSGHMHSWKRIATKNICSLMSIQMCEIQRFLIQTTTVHGFLITIRVGSAVDMFVQRYLERRGPDWLLLRSLGGLTLRLEPLKGLWRECNIKSRIIPQSLFS